MGVSFLLLPEMGSAVPEVLVRWFLAPFLGRVSSPNQVIRSPTTVKTARPMGSFRRGTACAAHVDLGSACGVDARAFAPPRWLAFRAMTVLSAGPVALELLRPRGACLGRGVRPESGPCRVCSTTVRRHPSLRMFRGVGLTPFGTRAS